MMPHQDFPYKKIIIKKWLNLCRRGEYDFYIRGSTVLNFYGKDKAVGTDVVSAERYGN